MSSLYAMEAEHSQRLEHELRQISPARIATLADAHELVHRWAGRWEPHELMYLLIALKMALAPDPTQPSVTEAEFNEPEPFV